MTNNVSEIAPASGKINNVEDIELYWPGFVYTKCFEYRDAKDIDHPQMLFPIEKRRSQLWNTQTSTSYMSKMDMTSML